MIGEDRAVGAAGQGVEGGGGMEKGIEGARPTRIFRDLAKGSYQTDPLRP